MAKSDEGNRLFPIFLKAENLRFLIVGGGYVGHEKVTALLKNSPEADVLMVAPEIRQDIVDMQESHPGLKFIHEKFQDKHLTDRDIVIAGTAFKELNIEVRDKAKAKGLLVNVADTPDLCDFYLCSIVKKGDLKIGISTNGKSPTLAKRMREMLEEVIPVGIQNILDNLVVIRDRLKGDFEHKVKVLDEITGKKKME